MAEETEPPKITKKVHRALLLDSPTELVELVVGAMLFLRGVHMLWSRWFKFPLELQGLLIPWHLTEMVWGSALTGLGLVQLVTAGHRLPIFRGVVSTLAAITQVLALLTYWQVDVMHRGAVPFIVGLILAELFIAYRSWASLLLRRRDRRTHVG